MTTGGPWLRLHAFLAASRANGPGLRAVLWLQGCSLGCPGCFNPRTHPAVGPRLDVEEVFGRVAAAQAAFGIEGITISGGEPLQQRPGLLALLGRVRAETGLSVIVLTGYTWQEIASMPQSAELLGRLDVVVAGRYNHRLHLGVGLRGSANKTIHLLTDRYCLADLAAVPVAEAIIDRVGDVVLSGINPPRV